MPSHHPKKESASAVDELLVFEANMRQALERYHSRTGSSDLVVTDMPFDEMLTAEADGLDGEPGDYEFAQRRIGIRALFSYLLAEGEHPLKIMKRLYAAGRGFGIEPFTLLTMGEAGLMFGETKAAVSWRVKFLSGMIEQQGMKGSQLSGQKSKSGTANYSAAQRGNTNRKNGKRRKKQNATAKNAKV